MLSPPLTILSNGSVRKSQDASKNVAIKASSIRAGPFRDQAGDQADAQLKIVPVHLLCLVGIELIRMIHKG
jgi:hypothetical protein